MAEWSKALRSGRSRVLPAWVRIPLLSRDVFIQCISRFLNNLMRNGQDRKDAPTLLLYVTQASDVATLKTKI